MQAPLDALIRSGITRWGAFCLFTLSVVAAATIPPTPSALQDVRFWTTTDTTRIALETSREVEFKHDALENPNRIFVDLIDTRPEKQFRGLAYSVPVGDARVKQVRVALNQKGVTRVVIDVSGPMTYKVSRLTAPERVMVEIRAPGAPAPKKKDAAPEISKSTPAKRFVAPTAPEPAARTANQGFAFSDDVPRLSASASAFPALPRGLAALGKAESASSRSTVTPRLSAAEPVESSEESSPAPAQRDRMGKHSMTRVLGLKLNRIVIDPGHGGHDQGTSSKSGLLEKELVLDVSKRLGQPPPHVRCGMEPERTASCEG